MGIFRKNHMALIENFIKPVPSGFSLREHKGFCLVLRDDLPSGCGELIVSLANQSHPKRGEIVIEAFPTVNGGKITGAFRRTVRGGPYDQLGFVTSFGMIPRTLIELRLALYALHCGVPTVQPLGCFWRRVMGGIGYSSGFISVYEEKVENLFNVLTAWKKEGVEPRNRRRTLIGVAKAIKTLHGSGINHPDLTLRNLFIQPDGSCLIADFDKASMSSSLSYRAIATGLSRINRSLEKTGLGQVIPVRDRLRFLFSYLDEIRPRDALLRRIISKANFDLRFHRLFWKRKRRLGEN